MARQIKICGGTIMLLHTDRIGFLFQFCSGTKPLRFCPEALRSDSSGHLVPIEKDRCPKSQALLQAPDSP